MNEKKIIIGTRGSRLALVQSRWVQQALQQACPDLHTELLTIQTKGDIILDAALSKIGDKGLFTREIENALLTRQIDLAVHSLKDLPTVSPPGLRIAAIPPRQDPADVLLSKDHLPLAQLPPGAVVLTSSLRRRAQLLHHRPDLHVLDIRGNVTTRIRKWQEGPAHALVMAAAGLNRLQLQIHITERLDPMQFLPACGQGALALQIRDDDTDLSVRLQTLDDPAARATTTAERSLLAALQGGCQIPIGAHAQLENGKLSLKAMIADVRGVCYITAEDTGAIDQPEELGKRLADQLIKQGAQKILDEIKSR